MVKLSWASVSQIGARESNEDALGRANSGESACFVLADGAGGHAGGETAARIVVDSVLSSFGANPACAEGALLAHAQRASEAVAQARQRTPEFRDMSATLAACVIDCAGARAQWAHLGDSRIYLFRQQRVHAVTRDHSMTQQLVDAGLVKAEQLRVHPNRNLLWAAIGAEGGEPATVSAPAPLLPGDALLLCSDGLWEWVLEDQMLATLAATPDSRHWLDAMCTLASAANARAGSV
ncbi:MAG: PP2C family protein-serine/threonine phosphatase, partial [Gammaproteobacteria bacterium]